MFQVSYSSRNVRCLSYTFAYSYVRMVLGDSIALSWLNQIVETRVGLASTTSQTHMSQVLISIDVHVQTVYSWETILITYRYV